MWRQTLILPDLVSTFALRFSLTRGHFSLTFFGAARSSKWATASTFSITYTSKTLRSYQTYYYTYLIHDLSSFHTQSFSGEIFKRRQDSIPLPGICHAKLYNTKFAFAVPKIHRTSCLLQSTPYSCLTLSSLTDSHSSRPCALLTNDCSLALTRDTFT